MSAIDCTAQAVGTHDFKVNTEQGVVVANDNYWRKIDHETPRGSKVQLLGTGGVAVYGQYNGDQFWTHWCPLPRRRKD